MYKLKQGWYRLRAKTSGRTALSSRGHDRAGRYFEYHMLVHPSAADEARRRMAQIMGG